MTSPVLACPQELGGKTDLFLKILLSKCLIRTTGKVRSVVGTMIVLYN